MRKAGIICIIVIILITLLNFANYVTANPSDDGWIDGTENIALNRPAYGYGLLPEYSDIKNINDGNYATQATIGPIADGFVVISLSKECYISKVKMKAKRLWTSTWEHNEDELDVILYFKTEKSNQWEEIYRIKDFNNGQTFDREIKTYGKKAKEVKLYKNGFSSGLDINQLVIFEVEIYEAIDVQPPITFITYGPEEGSFVKNSFEFKWAARDNANENEIKHQCRLIPLYPQWSEWSYETAYKVNNLNYEGQLTFEVRSKDLAGNIGDIVSRSFYIDRTPPNLCINSPKKGRLYIGNREIMPINRNYAVVVGNADIIGTAQDSVSGVSIVKLVTPFGEKSQQISEFTFKNCLYNGKYIYKILAIDKANNIAEQSIEILSYFSNSPPLLVDSIVGPATGKIGEKISYYAKAIDIEGDDIYYKFDWGDGTSTGWLIHSSVIPLSKETISASHTYKKEGTYRIRVSVKDARGFMEDYSLHYTVTIKKSTTSNLASVQSTSGQVSKLFN